MTKHILTIDSFEDDLETGSTITHISDEQERDIEYISRFTTDYYKHSPMHFIISAFYYGWVIIQEIKRLLRNDK